MIMGGKGQHIPLATQHMTTHIIHANEHLEALDISSRFMKKITHTDQCGKLKRPIFDPSDLLKW